MTALQRVQITWACNALACIKLLTAAKKEKKNSYVLRKTVQVAKFHNLSISRCPIYQKEIEKFKMKTCYDTKKLGVEHVCTSKLVSSNCHSQRNKVYQITNAVTEQKIYIFFAQETWLMISDTSIIQENS